MTWTLVTGGAQRLGAQICLHLAEKGYSLVIHYRQSESEAKEIADQCQKWGVKAEIMQGDFTTVKSTQAFASEYTQKFPDTKHLINNVGNYLIKSGLTTPIDEWVALFQTNLYAPLILTQALAENLKDQHGSIVNIGVTGVQSIRSDTYSTAYSCAKTSLWMMTKSLAAELAPSLVRVNMISPGYLNFSIDLPKEINKLSMNEFIEAHEVAEMVYFLISDKGKHITGQNIEIAGGVRL